MFIQHIYSNRWYSTFTGEEKIKVIPSISLSSGTEWCIPSCVVKIKWPLEISNTDGMKWFSFKNGKHILTFSSSFGWSYLISENCLTTLLRRFSELDTHQDCGTVMFNMTGLHHHQQQFWNRKLFRGEWGCSCGCSSCNILEKDDDAMPPIYTSENIWRDITYIIEINTNHIK